MAGDRRTIDQSHQVKVLSLNSEHTVPLADILAYRLTEIRGNKVIFMPQVSLMTADLCKTLTEKFFIPRFFWTDIGVESNGFFGSKELRDDPDVLTLGKAEHGAVQKGEDLAAYATWGRFLSKKVISNLDSPLPTDIKGLWHYMAFYTISFSDLNGLLFCFDLDPDVQEVFEKACHKMTVPRGTESFYFPLLLCPAIVDQFDLDTWTFRIPIRAFEKNRLSNENVEFKHLHKRYSQMHELSRHAIHISETLKVATRVLGTIVEDYELNRQAQEPTVSNRKTLSALRSMKYRLNNIEDRAQAFVDRLNNEIQLAFNTAAAVQLEQTRNDGKTFADTIALLTLFFLPGTFVSGFFGMNFFSLEVDTDGNDKWKFSRWFWIFFACTVPLTCLCLLFFAMNLPIISTVLKWGSDFRKWRKGLSKSHNVQASSQHVQQPGPNLQAMTAPRGLAQVPAEGDGANTKTAVSSDLESGTANGDRVV